MKVLLIGGAGFLGFALCKKYLSLGANVHIVDNLSRGKLDKDLNSLLTSDQVKFYDKDLNTFYNKKLYSKDYDFIFHLAAIVGVANVQNNPYETIYDNINLTNIAIQIAHKQKALKRIVFTSTSEVYSGAVEINLAKIPTAENTPLIINNINEKRVTYKLSKIVGESMFLNSSLPVSIVRPHNIYGPRMGMSHVIPELIYKINKLNNGEALDVYSINHTRTFCYIDDAVNMLLKIAEKNETKGILLNLGTDKPEIKMGDLANIIISISKKKLKVNPLTDHLGSPLRRCPDMKKTLDILNYTYTIDLLGGLHNTFKWYMKTFKEDICNK
jgi:UDP-glucose 4-epimerase